MTSIKLFWSLAVHRHQKQHSMSCSFGQSGCQKTMVKNENFHAKICQNLKFFDIWELYTSKESLEHVKYKFKKRKYDFLQKKKKFEIFDFFPKSFWVSQPVLFQGYRTTTEGLVFKEFQSFSTYIPNTPNKDKYLPFGK